MKKYLAIGEVAKIKGVRVETVRDWTNSGKLEFVTTEGGHNRIIRNSEFVIMNFNYELRITNYFYGSRSRKNLKLMRELHEIS
ncbi:MerR family transcriptional regulator [Scytonema sp. UIC 10036]|nr:MerR family transcriptional regulator [Scytonema sp. UIC 10036]